ncbi:MAG: LacI family DNA-binding transcriptional regulator [Yoonia sp.]|uniref:LacI family DNA-binding transcriptional regulator n=1 Tax=Yoonia sp. TaxID=2212373 RepID=UPI003263D1E1
MKRSPTMKDVAKAAGVSVMTVSRAFKLDASVGAGTRARIQETADALGYVFDSTAATLRAQRSNFVAVTIPSLNNANFATMVEALTGVLSAAGYQVLLGHTNYDMHREEELIADFLQRRPEAIVVTGGRHTARARKLLAAAGVPVFETWDLPDDPIGHVVGFSNGAVIAPLVDHLVGLGHSKIGFIGGDTDSDTRGIDRRAGFVAAMAGSGLDPTRLIGSGAPQNPMQNGAKAMAALHEDWPDTTAVICVSDLVAFGALSECQRRGIAVPDDMAVVGFGAYDIAGACVPTLTTIDPRPNAMGQTTAQHVIAMMNGPQDKVVVGMDPVLRVGGSTLVQA